MDWYLYIVVIIAGFVAGYINTLAGSGSLVTLPLLIFLGLPPTVANGTNRVAILLQCAVAVGKFKSEKQLDIKNALILSIPAIIGAVIGAQIAADLNETIMRQTIGILMVIMLAVILIRPKRWLEGRNDISESKPSWLRIIVFFGIGLYGGFIQAGVGIFLLSGLVLGAGYNLVRANAAKNLIVLCFTVFALAVFIYNDQVDWKIGLILAIGNMLGAWVAAKMAVKRGAGFVRWILIAVIIISALMLLGAEGYIQNIFN